MSLKGTLGSFSIADIFQLIGHQQKSGVLFVRAPQNESRFFFSDGKVFLATMTGTRKDLLLGSLLLRAEVVTRPQLEQALLTQKTVSKSLGEILIQSKAIDISTLKEFLSLQLDEILTEVILWPVGSYEFVPEKISFNQNIFSARGTEGLLMECFRRKDEWPMIIQKVPSLDNVYKVRVDPSTQPPELDESEKNILSWIDRGKNLKDISLMSKLGTFEACRITAGLLDKGLISLAGQTTQHEHSSDDIGILLDYRHLMIFFMIGVILSYFLVSPRSILHSDTYPGKLNIGRAIHLDFSPQELSQQTEKQQMMNALDKYLLFQGKRASSMSELGIESHTLTFKTNKDASLIILK